MALFGWGKKKKGGEGDEEARLAEERLRWNSAITQQGTPGMGGTEEERAEAARLRRAALVAQDPTYVTRRLGGDEQPVEQREQVTREMVERAPEAAVEGIREVRKVGDEEGREGEDEAAGVSTVGKGWSPEENVEAQAGGGTEAGGPASIPQGGGAPLGPASPVRMPVGSKDTWYQSPAYTVLKQKFDQQGSAGSSVSPFHVATNGGWGELPQDETPEEAAQREARQQKLREDAGRTLGDRAKYFEDAPTDSSRTLQRFGDGPEAPVAPEQRKGEGKGGLYRRSWKEAADKKLASILGVDKSDVEAKQKQEAARLQKQKQKQKQEQQEQQQEEQEQEEEEEAQTPRMGGVSPATAYLPRLGTDQASGGWGGGVWEGVSKEDLPVIGEEDQEVGEAAKSVWKVIAPDDILVLAGPRDGEKPIGRLRRMQTVEVDREALPWLRIANVEGWVRVSGGKRGREIFLVRQGKTLGFDEDMERKWGRQAR